MIRSVEVEEITSVMQWLMILSTKIAIKTTTTTLEILFIRMFSRQVA